MSRSSTVIAVVAQPAVAVVFGAMLLALLAAGCVENESRLSQTETAQLKEAVKQANVIHDAVGPTLSADPELTAYVREVGKRLVEGARKSDAQRGALDSVRVDFHLVNNPAVNAFSTGGEHIYVYAGLFLRCGSEEELAAAMAHAMAHTTLRHLAKKDLPDSTDAVVLASQIIKAPYTPAEESDADKAAFQYYAHAGWDPYRFGDVYQRVGGREYNLRSQDPRRWADQLPSASQSWRRSPVADDRTFVQLQQKAKATPSPIRSDKPATILSALPNCLAATDQGEQAAARTRLQDMLIGPKAGNGPILHGPH
jgi:predicted Zn-dependent protease